MIILVRLELIKRNMLGQVDIPADSPTPPASVVLHSPIGDDLHYRETKIDSR